MRRTLYAMAFAVLFACPAFAAPRAEVEMSFQQDVNHYAGCRLVDAWNSAYKGDRGDVNKLILIYADLKLPGDEVKVESAELRMRFVEEGYSRIKNAKLELYDAAEKEGKPVATVEYRDRKLVGMDPKTKIVTWTLPAELVARWVAKPETNKGVRFLVVPVEEGLFQFLFHRPTEKVEADRPALVVKYSFTGEAPPFAPDILTNIAGRTFGPRFTVAWKKKRWDPNGTPVVYEIAIAPKGGEAVTLGKVDAETGTFEIDTAKLATDRGYELRLRATDPTGLSSDWSAAPGEFRVSREEYAVWTTDSVTKVPREENPPAAAAPVTLAAARNEFESFQVVVSALGNITGVDLVASDLLGPGGAKIPAAAIALYRVHYVDCAGQGWLPDSLVPFVNPKTGKRIGGPFGAPFDVAGGANAPVWVETRVPADAAPGDYKGEIKVTVAGKAAATIPVALTVWPVTLPKTSTLLTYFELTADTPQHDYLNALHEHRIDVWFVNDVGHKLERDADKKPVVKWSEEMDRLLDDYFSGALFADGVPGKSYLFPGGSWDVHKAVQGTDEDRVEILKQYEAHYKAKPWVGKCSWFFIDEPNPQTLIKCQRVGKQIKENSPSIGLLLTTRWNKDMLGLVDVWDAIVNSEVLDWNSPGPDRYREEMKAGRHVINCITCNSDQPTSPNLFIHRPAMNTRIWTWVTFALDQQGIEFWRTNAAPSVTVPKKFGAGTWGDGSLFYKGLPAELGVEEEITLPSIRLKVLRDGIEDFELLAMLRAKDPALAKKLAHVMAQETKDYDKSFLAPVQHVSWNWNTDGKGDRQVPGFVIWESSAKRLAEARAAMAKALGTNP